MNLHEWQFSYLSVSLGKIYFCYILSAALCASIFALRYLSHSEAASLARILFSLSVLLFYVLQTSARRVSRSTFFGCGARRQRSSHEPLSYFWRFSLWIADWFVWVQNSAYLPQLFFGWGLFRQLCRSSSRLIWIWAGRLAFCFALARVFFIGRL